jgi:ATP-dependent DNA helicase RecG
MDMDGPLPEMLETALEWVQRNTVTTIRFGSDGHGRDATELPMVAVRELIANALVHRDLGPHAWTQRVEIRLRADELVITNPGGLYGVSLQQLGTPTGKSAVNEFLYDICKLTRSPAGHRVIEGEGGGISEVRRSLRAVNLRPPRFSDAGVRFTAILPRHSLLGPADIDWIARHDAEGSLSSVQQQIITSMRHGQAWTNALVREEFAPIDSRDARAALQGLVNLGLAVSTGERGQTEYALAQTTDSVVSEAPPQVTIRPPSREAPGDQDELPGAPAERTGEHGGVTPTADLTKNAPAVWLALGDQPLFLDQVVQRTGLTERQVRYAVTKLTKAGLVSVKGGQGVRSTTYTRTDV